MCCSMRSVWRRSSSGAPFCARAASSPCSSRRYVRKRACSVGMLNTESRRFETSKRYWYGLCEYTDARRSSRSWTALVELMMIIRRVNTVVYTTSPAGISRGDRISSTGRTVLLRPFEERFPGLLLRPLERVSENRHTRRARGVAAPRCESICQKCEGAEPY
jgi:hypothetical protein